MSLRNNMSLFRLPCRVFLHKRHSGGRRGFRSSLIPRSHQPNSPLNLDSSLQALLKDVDITLLSHKPSSRQPLRELEAFPVGGPDLESALYGSEESSDGHMQRKSPAALFGSQRIGAVVLPFELQRSINLIIAESDKPQLHIDAKRLFYDDDKEVQDSGSQWEAKYDPKYSSRRQAVRHSERDGTAFVSVALPAHYAAITAVLDHVKRRLEPEWRVERVIDWGAGTGGGLWASLHSFQSNPTIGADPVDLRISDSSVITYLGVDKREGLVAMGKRLLQNVNLGRLSLTWQKSFHDDDKVKRSEGHDTIALSAFLLSSLPTGLARKALIKEMWESGAHVMVLLDQSTRAGFECIAEAREYLLSMGRKEVADPLAEDWPIRGSHVVAPCPHDSACPLFHYGSSTLECGFSQRLQRPEFVRRTKHSKVGHEDVGYSYVVVRRGPRPIAGNIKVGRIGEVGKWAMEKEALLRIPTKELILHGERGVIPATETDPPSEPTVTNIICAGTETATSTGLERDSALRLEAYSWPRLVFTPLKKSGHIILDSCTPEGKIMRLTIPKSQGKQPYYDARKSSWGDIFPHEPKNPPQERHQPIRTKRKGGATPTQGADIGKRRGMDKVMDPPSYETLSNDLKEKKKKSRRDRVAKIDPYYD